MSKCCDSLDSFLSVFRISLPLQNTEENWVLLHAVKDLLRLSRAALPPLVLCEGSPAALTCGARAFHDEVMPTYVLYCLANSTLLLARFRQAQYSACAVTYLSYVCHSPDDSWWILQYF